MVHFRLPLMDPELISFRSAEYGDDDGQIILNELKLDWFRINTNYCIMALANFVISICFSEYSSPLTA